MKLFLKVYAVLTGLLALGGMFTVGFDFVRTRLEERRFRKGMEKYYEDHPL